MATSVIWKATQRPWLTTFAPILISFSLNVVPLLDRLGRRQGPQKIAEIKGERMKLKADGIDRNANDRFVSILLKKFFLKSQSEI